MGTGQGKEDQQLSMQYTSLLHEIINVIFMYGKAGVKRKKTTHWTG